MHSHCFAKPISEAMLADWAKLQETVGESADLFATLVKIVKKNKEREARGSKQVLGLPSGTFLEECLVAFTDLAEPWRTPAFHLLWYVTELRLRRAPV